MGRAQWFAKGLWSENHRPSHGRRAWHKSALTSDSAIQEAFIRKFDSLCVSPRGLSYDWVEVFGTTPGNLLETNGGPESKSCNRLTDNSHACVASDSRELMKRLTQQPEPSLENAFATCMSIKG